MACSCNIPCCKCCVSWSVVVSVDGITVSTSTGSGCCGTTYSVIVTPGSINPNGPNVSNKYKTLAFTGSGGCLMNSSSDITTYIYSPEDIVERGSGGCLMNESSTISTYISTPDDQAETGSGGCLMNESSTIVTNV